MYRENLVRIIGLGIAVTAVALLMAEGLLNFTPPVSRDALIHHLAIPKLWLRQGEFYEIPWAKYSYYPMNVDLLYLLCLYAQNDIAPKFVHFAFGLGTGLLLYFHLKRKFSRNWGLLGGLMFLSTPVVIRLSTSAYVDLGLIFFTTGAVLLFLRWRDSDYLQLRWLLASAIAMGLALGCKYNAIIPWVFLGLAATYYFARDTKKQVNALGYGILFFLLSLVVVSPWYIKNYLLTSNPVYPLFDGFFNPAGPSGSGGGGGIGFFQRRELVYGETVWETLLIPLRMFFQGRDHSPQYFDGVLNPILILFTPFGLLKKTTRRNTIFFIAFSVFVLVTVFFLGAAKIRYVLPVVPVLAIASTTGIKVLMDFAVKREELLRYTTVVAVIGTIVLCLISNFRYLRTHFQTIQPMDYICQRETRDQFLTRHVASYPAVRYINEHLPDTAEVFLIFMAGRGYYIDRNYYHEDAFGRKTIGKLFKAATNGEEDFVARLNSGRFTHILMRKDLVGKYLTDNFEEKEIAQFLHFIGRYWNPLFDSGGYAVFKVLK